MDGDLFQEYFEYIRFSDKTQFKYYDSRDESSDEGLLGTEYLSEKLSALVCSSMHLPSGI